MCCKKIISLAHTTRYKRVLRRRFWLKGKLEKALTLYDDYDTPAAKPRSTMFISFRKHRKGYKRMRATAELDDGNLSIAVLLHL